ncbi:MAG: C39 family peptidase [Bacilli bacterium]|nr:C39 family peptidase [Bacilli bacterium]
MNIKKGIFALLIIFIVLLSSCEKEENVDILKEFTDSITFSDTLDGDLALDKDIDYKGHVIKATWESSDQNILTNDGKYYYTLSDELVSLNATFTYEDNTTYKTFEFMSYANADKAFMQAYQELELPSTIDSDLELAQSIRVGKSTYRISYESKDESIISKDGIITLSKDDKTTILKVTLTNSKSTKTFDHNITVSKVDKEKLQKELEKLYRLEFITPTQLDFKKELDYNNKKIRLYWSSDHKELIDDSGEVSYCDDETIVITITVSTDFDVSYSFPVNLAPIADTRSLELALEEISLPSIVVSDITLADTYSYGTKATWTSSNENILSNDGKIGNVNKFMEVSLNLTLSKGDKTMEKEFKVNVCKEEHFYQDRTFADEKVNVEVKKGKLVLKEGEKEGYYLSKEVSTKEFKSIVGSYAALSSPTSTCELEVRVKVGANWSKFFSYGAFGLGKKNYCMAQSDTYIKMVEDEILLKEGYKGSGFQFKLTLRRESLSDESPVVALIALAPELIDYTFNVDISTLPKVVKYDVPKLYQHIVPTIGGIICSATSSTMLLKFKGHDFSDKATYEHEYIAEMVLDSGNDIYGNWVYNTIAMSAFGEIAYVKRFYSANEMLYSLAKVGPMAASIRGNTITNLKTYNTAGHLFVVTGYKIDDSGTTIYINDPNVMGVAVEMTLENFLKVYRMVSYIVE